VIDEIASQQPGTRIALSIERSGSERVVNLTLSSYGSKAHEAYADNPIGLPYLGVEAADLTPQLRRKDGMVAEIGVVVIGVTSGSSAADAGLADGDVIVSVGSHRITDTQDLSDAVALASGTSWQIAFKDLNNQRHVADVTAGTYQAGFYPPEVAAL
jgi:S1-C subfamily serine protease